MLDLIPILFDVCKLVYITISCVLPYIYGIPKDPSPPIVFRIPLLFNPVFVENEPLFIDIPICVEFIYPSNKYC
jgi:hypothetical protein